MSFCQILLAAGAGGGGGGIPAPDAVRTAAVCMAAPCEAAP